MGKSEVAIVIPAFNEAATITGVVKSVSKYGQPIVIDDHSSDGTYTLAKNAGAIVIKHDFNRGYDSALNTGFVEADHRGFAYVVTFDADGQHNEQLLEQFIDYLKQGYELVLGTRPEYARLGERIFAYYTRIRFGLRDPLCGMKGYSLELYRERGCFDSYNSIGTELALYGASKKKAFIQLPIPITSRIGVSRFGFSWKANYKIFRAMGLSFLQNR